MGALAFLAVACSDPPAPTTAPTPAPPPASAASAPSIERALSYEPGDSLTDQRIARAQAAVRAAPTTGDALDGLAILFVRRFRETADGEDLRRAEELVNAALAVDENDPVALDLSGMLAMQAHRFADAQHLAERILAQDPQDTTALLLLGDAQLELGDYEPAVTAYQRASDLRPDLRTYNRGAYARWLYGDPQGALELLQLAMDAGSVNDPESTAWCWVDLATVHWHLGNRLQTRVALERALALMPDYLPALRLRARLLASEGDAAGATAILEQTIARQELVGELLYLSELLETAGRHDDAALRVARAVEMRREDPRTLAVYRLRHGIETEDASRVASAELGRRHDVYTRAAHALALARSGQGGEARAEMDRALALGTPDVGLIVDSGVVAHLAGDDAAARAALDRARGLNPFVDRFLFDALATELDAPPSSPSPIVTTP